MPSLVNVVFFFTTLRFLLLTKIVSYGSDSRFRSITQKKFLITFFAFFQQTAPIMFGALLKERRKKAQLSQKDFADMMHVTRNTVINWETDKSKPDYSLIPELCTLLNIQIHELFHMQAQTALGDLEDLFVEEIREFNEDHNLGGWE